MASRIKLRRDIAINWTTINPVLSNGEVGVELDTQQIKLGSGSVPWNNLPYLNTIGIPPTGSVSSSAQVIEYIFDTDIQPNSVQSNEYKLVAGDVSLTFTGSINSGVFGVTEDVFPYISTIEYSGTSIEYVAQRPGATRIGIILATWSGSNVVFTDVSTADIGDTRDISFAFIKSGDFFKLRVNSFGSGSGAWTVQSLFKLFPNLDV